MAKTNCPLSLRYPTRYLKHPSITPPHAMNIQKLGYIQDIILVVAAVSHISSLFPKSLRLIDLPQILSLSSKGAPFVLNYPMITNIHTQNVSIYYAVKYALSRVESDGEKEQGKKKAAAAAVLRRLDSVDNDEEAQTEDGRNRRPRKENLVLNQWEQAVAMDIVAPDDIPVTFEGGVLGNLKPTIFSH